MFWSYIGQCASHVLPQLFVKFVAQVKVKNDWAAIVVDEQVGWLQITMDDAALMRVTQTICRLLHELYRKVHQGRVTQFRCVAVKSLTRDKFFCIVRVVYRFHNCPLAVLVDSLYQRVAQPRRLVV